MEFVTTNGNKKIKITPASFQDAVNLKKAAYKALKESGFLKDSGNLSAPEFSDVINVAFDLISAAESSSELEAALFECLKVCIYDEKYKISKQLFDDFIDLREDYYEIMTKCLEVNLRPFFKSLVTEFKTRLNQFQESPLLKSAPISTK